MYLVRLRDWSRGLVPGAVCLAVLSALLTACAPGPLGPSTCAPSVDSKLQPCEIELLRARAKPPVNISAFKELTSKRLKVVARFNEGKTLTTILSDRGARSAQVSPEIVRSYQRAFASLAAQKAGRYAWSSTRPVIVRGVKLPTELTYSLASFPPPLAYVLISADSQLYKDRPAGHQYGFTVPASDFSLTVLAPPSSAKPEATLHMKSLAVEVCQASLHPTPTAETRRMVRRALDDSEVAGRAREHVVRQAELIGSEVLCNSLGRAAMFRRIKASYAEYQQSTKDGYVSTALPLRLLVLKPQIYQQLP
jgi:hypothetical protein